MPIICLDCHFPLSLFDDYYAHFVSAKGKGRLGLRVTEFGLKEAERVSSYTV